MKIYLPTIAQLDMTLGSAENGGDPNFWQFQEEHYAKPSGFAAPNFETTSNVPRNGGQQRKVLCGLELKPKCEQTHEYMPVAIEPSHFCG